MSTKKHDGGGTDDTSTTAVATRQPALVRMGVAWDPFALMDRLDADSVIAEMQGIASDVLVYKIKDGNKETVGLSKAGVDECCTMLVSQGQCIREENLKVEYIGEGEDREAIFTVTAARFAVHPDGREVRLDQVLGVKREPLYEQRAPLTIDSKVPGKRWRHLTFEQAARDYGEADNDDRGGARGYLEWIVNASTFDDDTKAFVAMVLNGEDVTEFAMGKRFNNFWFEHGAMKAARNARFRLIPAGLKAQVMALAQSTPQRVKEVERAETAATPLDAKADTTRRIAERETKRQERERDTNRRAPDVAPYLFPFGDFRGKALDGKHPAGHERAGQYVISDELIARAAEWAEGRLSGKPFARTQNGPKMPITDAERPKFEGMRDAMHTELEERLAEREEQGDSTAATTMQDTAAEAPPPAADSNAPADETPQTADGRDVDDDLPF